MVMGTVTHCATACGGGAGPGIHLLHGGGNEDDLIGHFLHTELLQPVDTVAEGFPATRHFPRDGALPHARETARIRHDRDRSGENDLVTSFCQFHHFIATNDCETPRHRTRRDFIGILLHAQLLPVQECALLNHNLKITCLLTLRVFAYMRFSVLKLLLNSRMGCATFFANEMTKHEFRTDFGRSSYRTTDRHQSTYLFSSHCTDAFYTRKVIK
mmetsp:Transcript_19384/g.32402  ORF Transcript_19384/g.32402 Transcript_19384/m.32402 type:complete len:214 (-) Transcript_19384:122-763(-)